MDYKNLIFHTDTKVDKLNLEKEILNTKLILLNKYLKDILLLNENNIKNILIYLNNEKLKLIIEIENINNLLDNFTNFNKYIKELKGKIIIDGLVDSIKVLDIIKTREDDIDGIKESKEDIKEKNDEDKDDNIKEKFEELISSKIEEEIIHSKIEEEIIHSKIEKEIKHSKIEEEILSSSIEEEFITLKQKIKNNYSIWYGRLENIDDSKRRLNIQYVGDVKSKIDCIKLCSINNIDYTKKQKEIITRFSNYNFYGYYHIWTNNKDISYDDLHSQIIENNKYSDIKYKTIKLVEQEYFKIKNDFQKELFKHDIDTYFEGKYFTLTLE